MPASRPQPKYSVAVCGMNCLQKTLSGHTRAFGALEGVFHHALVVCVQDFDVGVRPEQLLHKPHIRGEFPGRKAGADVDIAAQRADFVVIVARLRLVDKKVELDLAAVDAAVVVHQHGFNARTIHVADGMQNAYHFFPPSRASRSLTSWLKSLREGGLHFAFSSLISLNFDLR